MNAETKAVIYALKQLLKHDPRPALFGFRAPGIVRRNALLGLEEREESDFLVRHAEKDIAEYAPLKELLETWHKDGHWGISRLHMKAHGEKKAEKLAVRTALLNYARLSLYGFDLNRQVKRVSRFIQFSWKYLYGPAVETSRLSNQACYFSETLAAAGLHSLIPDSFSQLMRDWRSALVAEDPSINPLQQKHTLRASAMALHTLKALSHAGEAGETEAEQLLSRVYPMLEEEEYSEKLDHLKLPQSSFSLMGVLELAVLTGGTLGEGRIRTIVDRIVALQQENSLWPSGRETPIEDENLFLTLEVVLLLKALTGRSIASGDLSAEESGDQA